jgi:hypothetical protein
MKPEDVLMSPRLERWRFLVLAAALSVTVGCASSNGPQSDLDLEIDGDEIRLALSEELARASVEGLLGSGLQCEGAVDPELRRLLEALDQGGPRSKAGLRDGQTTLEGRRRGSRVTLELSGTGPGSIELTMPWAAAECLLGRPTRIDRAVSDAIRVEVRNPDGRNFSFTVD